MKSCAYKQSEDASASDGVPIEECAGDLMSLARLSLNTEPQRKRV